METSASFEARYAPLSYPTDPLLQGFQCLCKRAALGFVYEEMYVLRRDDVSVHAQSVGLPDPFQRGDEDCAGL